MIAETAPAPFGGGSDLDLQKGMACVWLMTEAKVSIGSTHVILSQIASGVAAFVSGRCGVGTGSEEITYQHR